jgi:hypothetical protein
MADGFSTAVKGQKSLWLAIADVTNNDATKEDMLDGQGREK